MAIVYAQSPRTAPKPKQAELDPSLLTQLKDVGLGGLSRTGNFLDLVPSMFRDALAARNPFDQVLTPFSSENRTSGEQLLKDYGYKDAGFWSGLAAETALNPFALLGVGFGTSALSRAGKAAKAAGLLDETGKLAGKGRLGRMTGTIRDVATDEASMAKIAKAAAGQGDKVDDLMDMPLQGLVGYQFPFGLGKRRVLGTGEKSQKVASALDKIGDEFGRLAPVRHAKALFDSSVKGAVTPVVQKYAKAASRFSRKEDAANRQFLQQFANLMKDKGWAGEDADRWSDYVRSGLESFDLPNELKDFGALREKLDDILTSEASRGRKAQELEDILLNYVPRYQSPVAGEKLDDYISEYALKEQKREPFLKEISGGTERIRGILKDPELNDLIAKSGEAGLDRIATSDAVKKFLQAKHGDAFQYGEDFDKKLDSFADWTHFSLNKQQRESGFFGNHVLADIGTRLGIKTMNEAGDQVVFNTLGDVIEHKRLWDKAKKGHEKAKEIAAAEGRDIGELRHSTIVKEFEAAGLDPKVAMKRLSEQTGLSEDLLRNTPITMEVSQDLARLRGKTGRMFNGPVSRQLDSLLNGFKASVTSPFPAFHSRNLISGQVQSIANDQWDFGSATQVFGLLRGKTPKAWKSIPAVREYVEQQGMQLSDETAAQAVKEMAAARGLTQQGNNAALDIVGHMDGDVMNKTIEGAFFDDLAGTYKARDVAKQFAGRADGTTVKPPVLFKGSRIRGVGGAERSSFGPFAAGETVGEGVEAMNRLVPFVNQLKRGVDPDEAARRVIETQIDYSSKAFTPFERDVMKRLFPFYSFSKGVVGPTARTFAERPGGILGEGVRTATRLRQESEGQGVVPEYISDTAAIPLPSGKNGDPRYLTGFGLMVEDPISFIAPPKDAALEAVSRMNPLIKGPLEYAFGLSTFQKRRPLETMDPPLGRFLGSVMGRDEPVDTPQWTEQVISNSPLARFLSTARTLSDDRKDWGTVGFNLLTGGRITDIPEAAQDYALRQKAVDMLGQFGGQKFETMYLPENVRARMTPEQIELAESLIQLRNVLDKRRRDRKKTDAK